MTIKEVGNIVNDGGEVMVGAIVVIVLVPIIIPLFLIGLIRRGIVWLLA